MDANDHMLRVVFAQDLQLMAPLFQRPYVWEKDLQWEPLWEDIRDLAQDLFAGKDDVKPHFLGAIVLDQRRTLTGKEFDGPAFDRHPRMIMGMRFRVYRRGVEY